MIVLAIWGVFQIATLRDQDVQFAILGVMIIGFFLITIKREYPIDLKLIIFAMFGYALAGKGFAYLSPTPSLPLYVGEIVFVISGVMLVLFRKEELLSTIRKSRLLQILLLFLVYAAVRVWLDRRSFGLLAVRDSSLVYYSFFCFVGATLFVKEKYRTAYTKCFVIAIFIACFSNILTNLRVVGEISQVFSYYKPHADAMIPFIVAGFFYAFYKMRDGKRQYIFLLLLTLLIIATSKAAYGFAFIAACIFLVMLCKRTEVTKLAVVSTVVIAFGLALFIAFTEGNDIEIENDLINTVQLSSSDDSFEGSTTDWRLTWWRVIANDTMEQAPLFGKGFGSDISTEFYFVEYGRVLDPETPGLPRYPHNAFFTILGRLGISGCFFFIIYCICLAKLQ